MTGRQRGWWLLTACVLTWPAGQAVGADQQRSTPSGSRPDCASLLQLKLPDVRVTEAVAAPPDRTIKVPHCRVGGVVGREIRFSLLLPDEWNERFVMGGGGGFVGGIDNQALATVNAGYATVGTDTGHQGCRFRRPGRSTIWSGR